MEVALYTEGCIILSLTAGPLSLSHSNGKMPILFLYTSKKGDRAECVNSRSISLRSVAGKVLASHAHPSSRARC